MSQARADLARGNFADAARLLSEWLAKHPGDTNARLLLGRTDEGAGNLESAEAQFKRVIAAEPDNSEALVSLASLYDRARRPDLAEPLLARAVRASPHSQAARLAWASVLAELHRYAEAATALRGVRAPESANQKLDYLRLEAAIASGNGDSQAAARNMESALALRPANQGLRAAAGIAEVEAAHWARAAQLLAPVYRSTRDPRIGLALLEAEIKSRDTFASTLSALRASAGSFASAAQRADLRYAVGNVLLKAGRYSDAEADFETAAAEAPSSSAALAGLAEAQLGAGSANAAFDTASRAARLADSAAIERLLGDIEERRGHSVDAVHHYQTAVTLSPGNERNWLALGTDLLRHQTYQPALEVFKQASSRFPRSVRVWVALGMTQYFLDQYPQAIQTLLAASRLDPASAIPIDYLGQIQMQQQVTPQPKAIAAVCDYADAHPKSGAAMAYCGALLARKAHDAGAAAPPPDAVRRLSLAVKMNSSDGFAHCELGKALEADHQWKEAQAQMSVCVRLEPSSAEGYYRLAEIDRHLGDITGAREALKKHDEAVRAMVASNASHDATLQKFLYTIGPAHK